MASKKSVRAQKLPEGAHPSVSLAAVTARYGTCALNDSVLRLRLSTADAPLGPRSESYAAPGAATEAAESQGCRKQRHDIRRVHFDPQLRKCSCNMNILRAVVTTASSSTLAPTTEPITEPWRTEPSTGFTITEPWMITVETRTTKTREFLVF